MLMKCGVLFLYFPIVSLLVISVLDCLLLKLLTFVSVFVLNKANDADFQPSGRKEMSKTLAKLMTNSKLKFTGLHSLIFSERGRVVLSSFGCFQFSVTFFHRSLSLAISSKVNFCLLVDWYFTGVKVFSKAFYQSLFWSSCRSFSFWFVFDDYFGVSVVIYLLYVTYPSFFFFC